MDTVLRAGGFIAFSENECWLLLTMIIQPAHQKVGVHGGGSPPVYRVAAPCSVSAAVLVTQVESLMVYTAPPIQEVMSRGLTYNGTEPIQSPKDKS